MNAFFSVYEIIRESEYRVDFTSSGISLSLHIRLTLDFPQVKPIIQVTPHVNHPTVMDNGHVTAPGLRNVSNTPTLWE